MKNSWSNTCWKKYFNYCWFLLLFVACQKAVEIEPVITPALMEIPRGFPTVEAPEGNTFTPARWALGKKLFFDPVLSLDSTLSCASCHRPELAFSDQVAFSDGVNGEPGIRNASPLFNLAYHPYFTREGGVPTLEMQVLIPIQEHNELNFNIVLIAERLSRDSTYIQMSQEAYDRPPDHFVITRAIACFERSLLSGFSPYDQQTENEQSNAISNLALDGKALFFSERTNCNQCHTGFNFTNYTLENNGLYEAYSDPGLFKLTNNEVDKGRFKVPTLRNIALTSPYMHDGSIQSLEAVVAHYNAGGKNHPNQSHWIRPLELTTEEQKALVAFLHSLTDATFVNNPLFKP